MLVPGPPNCDRFIPHQRIGCAHATEITCVQLIRPGAVTVQSGWTEGLLPGARLLPGGGLSLPFCTMWLGSPHHHHHHHHTTFLAAACGTSPEATNPRPRLPRLSALSARKQWMGAAPRLALHRTRCFLRPLGKFFMLAAPEKTQWKGHKRFEMFLVPSKQLRNMYFMPDMKWREKKQVAETEMYLSHLCLGCL